jgi:hypothetical protein
MDKFAKLAANLFDYVGADAERVIITGIGR